MSDLNTATLKEIVTSDYRAAALFEKYSLDFCCKGGKTVEQACADKNLNKEVIIADLRSILQKKEKSGDDYASLSLDELVQHILLTHHAYIHRVTPVLLAHTRKVATVHGERHPEVAEIADRFEESVQGLMSHMMREERVLFPYIQTLAESARQNVPLPYPPFGSIRNPIRMMESEHATAGDEFYTIRSLSSNYTPPEDACTTYRVSYLELQEFERDLHQHVHLENNILFPQAVALEEEVFSADHQENGK
jgi:regulator of cell morphogenesis and NO signaling